VSPATSPALRLGTRGSALALAQAQLVAGAIGEPVELVTITTSGDRGTPAGDKRRWIDRIEDALLADEIDLAVHSAKDVPGVLAEGLELAGSPARASALDCLCGAGSLAELAPGARVGTSSLRRRAQLLALRPDIEVVALNGNVDTRLRKLAGREVEAIVLATAGLERLGVAPGTALAELVPAVGQGTLALEARAGDARVAAALAPIRDGATERELRAERALAAALGATCETPIGAHARTLPDGALELTVFIGEPDGTHWIRDCLRGDDADRLAGELAARLRSVGALELVG
jgi:hydroxymethylbilane synthase